MKSLREVFHKRTKELRAGGCRRPLNDGIEQVFCPLSFEESSAHVLVRARRRCRLAFMFGFSRIHGASPYDRHLDGIRQTQMKRLLGLQSCEIPGSGVTRLGRLSCEPKTPGEN